MRWNNVKGKVKHSGGRKAWGRTGSKASGLGKTVYRKAAGGNATAVLDGAMWQSILNNWTGITGNFGAKVTT